MLSLTIQPSRIATIYTGHANASMTPKTILLINDNASVREVIQDCLSFLGGWTVLTANSDIEGLQKIQHHLPDAVVLALAPGETLRFLRDLRSQIETKTLPVILMTSRAKWIDPGLIQQYQLAGVIDILLEPALLPGEICRLLNWTPT